MANGGFGGGFGEALESMKTVVGKQMGSQIKQTTNAVRSQVGLPQTNPQGVKPSANLENLSIDEKNQGQSPQNNQGQTNSQSDEQSLSPQELEKQKKDDEAKLTVARQAIQDLQQEMEKLRKERERRDEERKQEGEQVEQENEEEMQPVALPGAKNQPLENVAEQRAKTKTEAGRGATG